MEVTTQLVTPEMARQWLMLNNNNRKLKQSLVSRIKADIEANDWQMTHQPIAIGEDGRLLDGQHRLTAIAAANIAVPLMVATGCQAEIFAVIDTGTKRTVADTLHINGVKNGDQIAAAVRLYIAFQESPNLVWVGAATSSISTSRIKNEYDGCAATWNRSVTLSNTSYSRFRLLNRAAMSCMFVLLDKAGYKHGEIERFADDLSTGAMLAHGDPVFALRSALTSGSVTGATKKPQGFLAAYIKAFNYRREGVSLKLFKWPNVPPMPAILPPAA